MLSVHYSKKPYLPLSSCAAHKSLLCHVKPLASADKEQTVLEGQIFRARHGSGCAGRRLISNGWVAPRFSRAGTGQVEELHVLNLFRQLRDSLPTK